MKALLPALSVVFLSSGLAGGLVTLDRTKGLLTVESNLNFTGSKSTRETALATAKEIALMWREPVAYATLADGSRYKVEFKVTLTINRPSTSFDSCRENYITLESTAAKPAGFETDDRSLVLRGTNRGRFYIEDDLGKSTTAAHEFGHLMGLHHTEGKVIILDEAKGLWANDLRDSAEAGIMFNRGTWVKPEFQYDPKAEAGQLGGTINPYLRKVRVADIEAMDWKSVRFNERGQGCIGPGTPY